MLRWTYVRRLLLALSLAALTAAAPSAEAGRASGRGRAAATAVASRGRPAKNRRPRPTVDEIQRRRNPWTTMSPERQQVVRNFHERRRDWILARGEIFRRITQERNYSRDYVLHRNKKVTAFLDWSDPKHPSYDPRRKTGEQHILDTIPEARRAHILVVPNKARQHIARQLGAQITSADLDAASATIKEAEKLAKRLGLKKPRIWINSPDSISVGYLHVHIIGERSQDYPSPLQPNGRRAPLASAN